MTVATKNTAGLIERLEVGDLQERLFPYMQHWRYAPVLQSFAGTASGDHERRMTVGYIGHTEGGIVLALAGCRGWNGVRANGEMHPGESLDNAFHYSKADPFPSIMAALEHVLARR
jgi:hypothetical protein